MHSNKVFESHGRQKWLSAIIVMLAIVLFFGLALSVHAAGAQQIAGVGVFDAAGQCTDAAGSGADFVQVLSGDLEGCLYVFVESYRCSEGGVYNETGTELFVGKGPQGEGGTFMTEYRFVAKFQDCANLAGQFNGRCQHPIVTGSGTGEFEGVTGRLDFKDDVEAGVATYRGHLKY